MLSQLHIEISVLARKSILSSLKLSQTAFFWTSYYPSQYIERVVALQDRLFIPLNCLDLTPNEIFENYFRGAAGSGRDDDNPETLHKRFVTYNKVPKQYYTRVAHL
jgi:hypothetical protein